MSPIPPTPTFPSPAPTPSPFVSPHTAGVSQSASRASLRSGPHHPPQTLLGNGHPSSLKSLPRDNRELVLYAYVHLTGSLFLLPPPSLARAPALAALQRHKRGPRGGGSMNIGVASPPTSRGHERRSTSFAGSLWGLLSSPASAVLSPGHRPRVPSQGGSPTPSATRSFASAGAKLANHGKESVGLGLGGIGLGTGGMQEGEEWDSEQPMPVFEVPPAMLAVDLNLEPGEGRSCECSKQVASYVSHFYTLGILRYLYRETTAERATDLPGSHSQVLIPPVCRCVSSNYGYAKQPEQSDESTNTCLQSRLWWDFFCIT
jgi:hypothetical protein